MDREVLNRAPSNSPISIHQMSNKSYSKFQEEVSLKYGFIGLKLDKLSLTAEVSEEFHSAILNGSFILYDYFGVVEPNLNRMVNYLVMKGQFFR